MGEVKNLLEEAENSLERVQGFRVDELVQSGRLGEANFEEVVGPAKKIVSLFRQLPLSFLEYLPDSELGLIKAHSNSVYQAFNEILSFDVNEGDVRNRQKQAIDRIANSYQGHFTKLLPLISYSMARTVNFGQLEEQARAAVQEIRDQTGQIMGELEEQRVEASRVLDEVRKTAAERGVSQEAIYFKEEADRHRIESDNWRTWTIIMSVVVCLYGVSTIFLHKISYLNPEGAYETFQFVFGKILIFFVLAYVLSLCAKNFLSNRHNEIVNRHRQNALMTYRTLVDAGGSAEARDVILNHAASSVYKLHDTGYTKSSESSGSSSSSIVEMFPRASLPINSAGS